MARQYCNSLGKVAGCQVGVFLAHVGPKGRALVDKRLYLPERWTAAFGKGFDSMDGQPNKWSYVDKTGNVVIRQRFRVAQPFSEGLALVAPIDGSTPGYINASGHFVIQRRFDFGSDFHEGLAAITVNRKTGYIDKSGRIVIKPRFDDGGDFH